MFGIVFVTPTINDCVLMIDFERQKIFHCFISYFTVITLSKQIAPFYRFKTCIFPCKNANPLIFVVIYINRRMKFALIFCKPFFRSFCLLKTIYICFFSENYRKFCSSPAFPVHDQKGLAVRLRGYRPARSHRGIETPRYSAGCGVYAPRC